MSQGLFVRECPTCRTLQQTHDQTGKTPCATCSVPAQAASADSAAKKPKPKPAEQPATIAPPPPATKPDVSSSDKIKL